MLITPEQAYGRPLLDTEVDSNQDLCLVSDQRFVLRSYLPGDACADLVIGFTEVAQGWEEKGEGD